MFFSVLKIPVVIAMKAMGCQSDKEVLQLICGNDENFHSDFAINLEDAALCVYPSPFAHLKHQRLF